MRSCIFLFYIALFVLPRSLGASAQATPTGAAAHAPSTVQGNPDALYRARIDLAQANAAAAIWEARLAANPADVESAWKLARLAYWLGSHGSEQDRRKALERGIEAGRRATMLAPMRPEGYFWMAASMGELAESYGVRQGLRYRGPIKEALETVLRLDPAYQNGSADRALGRWYFKVPGLFGGSKQKSEEHLRRSLTYAPNSTASHLFLAETLFGLNRDADARDELRKVLAAPIDPEWEPEDHEFKAKAEGLLRQKR